LSSGKGLLAVGEQLASLLGKLPLNLAPARIRLLTAQEPTVPARQEKNSEVRSVNQARLG